MIQRIEAMDTDARELARSSMAFCFPHKSDHQGSKAATPRAWPFDWQPMLCHAAAGLQQP